MPLQSFHVTQAETIQHLEEKYVKARQRACEARQKALLGRQEYVRAVEKAEVACREVQETLGHDIGHRVDTPPTTNNTNDNNNNADEKKDAEQNVAQEEQDIRTSPPSSDRSLEEYGKRKGKDAADRVSRLLGEAKTQQRKYQALVMRENEAVQCAQRMEHAALEGLQKLEEQRLCVFYDSLVRTFREVKSCLDELVVVATVADTTEDATVSGKEGADDNDATTPKRTKQNKKQRSNPKKGDFFSILKVGPSNAKTGVADAEALGLEEHIGKLRDEMQNSLTRKIARLKKAKSLAAFLGDIAASADTLGCGLLQVIKHEASYISSQDTSNVVHLRTLMSKNEGPRTMKLWNDLMKMIESDANAMQQFATTLRTIKKTKLDPLLTTSEKLLRDSLEVDDGKWKMLCEAAKAESKAETKYRQSTVQMTKARNRISSLEKVDTDTAATVKKATEKPSPMKANRARSGMNKAFGNFLSILPDGGEQAMQMLTPEVRRRVAEQTLQEADQKESKGREALDNAIAHKNQCVESYEKKTQTMLEKLREEEKSGLEDIKTAIGELFVSMEFLRTKRYGALEPLSLLGEKPLVSALEDISEWTQKTLGEMSLELLNDSSNGASANCSQGFMLKVVLAESEICTEFAQIGQSDFFESAGLLDVSGEVPSAEHDESIRSLDISSVKKEDNDLMSGSKNSRRLHKSFSTPFVKPAFRKMRKMHTSGDADSDTELAHDPKEKSAIFEKVPPHNKREALETDLFLAFWPDYTGVPPAVSHSFACAFLPKNCTCKDAGAVEHGRLFLTHKGAVFVAWRGEKAIMYFSNMFAVAPHDSIFGLADDTLLVTTETEGKQNTLLLGSFYFRNTALEVLQERVETAMKVQAQATVEEGDVDSPDKLLPSSFKPVAPDVTLQQMEVVLSKKIRGISVDKFHEIVWADIGSSEKTFYGQWLGTGGKCSEIEIDTWETKDGIKGPWCGDSYTHKRSLAFKLRRNSRIGPPVAGVKQTQYCRLDKNERSIMQMTIAFDGIPYSDTFAVEVRWVATRIGSRDILIEVGVFVDFKKSTFLKTQIRNGTMTETKPVHENLFEFVKIALAKEIDLDGDADVNDSDEEDNEASSQVGDSKQSGGIFGTFRSSLPSIVADNLFIALPVIAVASYFVYCGMFSSSGATSNEIAALNMKIYNLQAEMKLMQQTIEELKELVQK